MSARRLAAVDLGSNSFRLQFAKTGPAGLVLGQRLKAGVRLAGGLQADGALSEAACACALEALHGFGEALREFRPDQVRAVATSTLRVACNTEAFKQAAEIALGVPIEVISGETEASLIYLGAAHALPPGDHRRLVIDIGGGSTECVIGEGITPLRLTSVVLGCVTHSNRFFADQRYRPKAFREAEAAARSVFAEALPDYPALGWDEAVGTSGTARALTELLEMNGLNPKKGSGITRAGLMALKEVLLEARSAKNLSLKRLRSDRLPVLPGGLSILIALFETLGLQTLHYADGALREGVLAGMA